MTMGLRPKREVPFDPSRPERELKARGRNWRPWLLLAGAIAVGVVIVKGEYLIPWWSPDRTPRIKPVEPAYDVAALTDFSYPPVRGEPDYQPNTRMIEIPKPVTQVVNQPPPPAPPPADDFEIEPVRISGVIGYAPMQPPSPAYMHDGRRPLEAWGCVIRPGLNVIHATFNEDVRWDYGGALSATVTEDVLSYEGVARGERRILIPAGAQLIGVAADPTLLKRGMDLASGPIWTEVSFADTTGLPRSINLFDAAGAGAGGINGIGGEVDSRWGQLIAAAVFFTLLDTLSSVNVNINIGDSGDAVSSSGVNIGGSAAAGIGREVIKSILDWRQIILTRKGTAVLVKPLKPVRVC